MMKWIKLAMRNILRNKRRSLVTLIAIAVGFSAISLFRGYTDRIYWFLKEGAIRGESLAHLTIYKADWLEKGKLDPERYMFSQEEIKRITGLVMQEKEVVLITPQIQVNGLITNGTISLPFIAQGVVPGDDKIIKGSWAALRPMTGEQLNDHKPYGVEVAKDLARFLNLEPGKDGVVMAPTLSGQMNALDIQVAGVFDTTMAATNDKFMRFNFDFAQSLYNTKGAEKFVVLLKDEKKTGKMRKAILAKLTAAGIACEIKTWNEMSAYYARSKGLLDVILLFILSIVLVIVTMSTVNTMSMAILERTREIGTLRALGLKQRGISILFATEGGLMGLFGSLAGIVIHLIVCTILRIVSPTYMPPSGTVAVRLWVDYIPATLFALMVFLVFLSLLTAFIAARRAAGQNIVDALKHV
ncbi:MAG: ABC transporter permease YtrF precursor [Syntrophorhabdus sp. PtaU1.Bin058]|nr:MAG: ABC transporter permease YtrF precursor [Syntrophorhabdus sp. PtaU1.Bin058]